MAVDETGPGAGGGILERPGDESGAKDACGDESGGGKLPAEHQDEEPERKEHHEPRPAADDGEELHHVVERERVHCVHESRHANVAGHALSLGSQHGKWREYRERDHQQPADVGSALEHTARR